ncbi:glycosyltransferase family A protein [Yonghaparkia sp. Soil809]|uniref:glycosyltransferase family A protein n=1 Tax=Yonghaparkia sp. Soil809 TaxID=1736417 RepID=UPI0006FC6620|nr:glycosyltransferase family 2 protein [Yonghaparkia sp. Soil809]KRF33703.1 rhamnosyl transferase [Yonghaparkia sp. Soil809]
MTESADPTGSITATVAILTYNGEAHLRRILDALRVQTGVEGEVEILVIDSGSTDGTLAIIEDFPEVRLHRIPNTEFQHGRTRNLAARLARGEFVVYLTHDAVPIGAHWLAGMLAPFALSPDVVGVVGKQVPRPRCFPLLKYEIRGVFAGLGPDGGVTLYRRPPGELDEGAVAGLGFYSDVNSAARREVLTRTIPYREVPYAEDQLFGQDVIRAGLIKAYAPLGAVEHSNDLTLAEYGKRIFDETVGLRRIGFGIPPMSRATQLRLTVRGILGDSLRIVRDRDFGVRRTLYWLLVNPVFQIRKWSSYRPATTVDLSDDDAIAAGSLEASRR